MKKETERKKKDGEMDFRKNKTNQMGLSLFWKVILGIVFAFIIAMIIIGLIWSKGQLS
jgi:hypothetical protein